MKVGYIKTMDFTFKNVEVVNCKNVKQLNNKIKKCEVIIINNDGEIEFVNSSYIMFYGGEINETN